MPSITIGRYDHESVTAFCSGWIEPADKSWIIFLDPEGRPETYYPERSADGGVLGEPVRL